MVNAVGSVDAFEQVQVTARVAGAVEQVRFAEGDVVKKGAPLVEIEVQRYQLAVRSAQAAMERAQGRRASTPSRPGAPRDAAPPRASRPRRSCRRRGRALATAMADVATAEARSRSRSSTCATRSVRAPVSGTIQTRTVETGQYVQAGSVLATLVQRDPLLLRFQVAEHEAAGLAAKMHGRPSGVRGIEQKLAAVITSVGQKADAG